MKLLICTQAVDVNDSDLGFFVRWIEEFAKQCEKVTVICLREGAHALPKNVQVITLGRGGKLGRVCKLLWHTLILSKKYDSVFVHMNPEYLVAVGWLWKLLGKKTALWYTHKQVDAKLRFAIKFATVVLTASKESFRLASTKVRVMGHGIDIDFFSQDSTVRGDEVLSVGRLAKSKRHDLILRAAQYFHREVWISGEGPEFDTLQELAKKLQVSERVHLLGARTHLQLRELYRHTRVFAHTSETGSMDKVVLEALLCGLPVVTTSEAYRGLLEPYGLYVEAEPKALAAALERARDTNISTLTNEVRTNHSLQNLIPAILKELA